MKVSTGGLSLFDVVDMAHRRRLAGSYLLACSTFLTAAHLTRLADLREHEAVYLEWAWECHLRVMEQLQ